MPRYLIAHRGIAIRPFSVGGSCAVGGFWGILRVYPVCRCTTLMDWSDHLGAAIYLGGGFPGTGAGEETLRALCYPTGFSTNAYCISGWWATSERSGPGALLVELGGCTFRSACLEHWEHLLNLGPTVLHRLV